ncbi:MAG TPA: PEGA domain-containing protein [Candidatus Sulfotelmatobacter sp.]
MSTKIGHFEILSELAKSATGAVYKANDPESGQTVVLKAIQLSAFGEDAAALQQALTEETESTKSLTSSNITPIFGAGEIEGQFCISMEYVQGNSIATMLARKEGFSIWDLLDIGRQVCSGLDKAAAAQVHHYSLEPAKIMCAWDGSIKILSMGASSAGKFVSSMPGEIPSILHYMSPEQVLGDKIDGRSNLFSLGAMFYEMVTDRKAFEGADLESVRQRILDSTPTPPVKLNPKLHPLLSDLIMRAISKDPAERFQNGRELLDSLEKCKESKPAAANKLAPKPLPAVAPKAPTAPKTATPPARAAAPPPSAVARVAPPVERPAEKFATPVAAAPRVQPKRPETFSAPAEPSPFASAPKTSAAAAGWGANSSSTVPGFDAPSESMTTDSAVSFATEQESPYMSSAVAEPPAFEPAEPQAPKLAVDPMMAEDAPVQAASTSFSEISELPPLKEVVIKPEAPPPPPPPTAATPTIRTMFHDHADGDDKPKVHPREVAQKAIKEVKSVPPQLMLYSIAGAVVLILVVTIGLWVHIHNISGGDDDSGAARPTAPATETETQPADRQQAAPQSVPETHAAAVAPPRERTEEPVAESPREARGHNARKKAAAAPVVVPGQMTVDSTPQGAQVQLDGATDPSWVTPLSISSLDPGPHAITVSKSGYVTDSRTIKVVSGSKSSVVIHLNQLTATLSVTSNPAGANIYVDGRDMGKLTPAQVSVDKGQHIILIRKIGYIDETTSAQFSLGQTVALSPTLRPMGNVDNIHTVGKMKKLFGGSGAQPGQGTISIRTSPKGAQVAINQHMLDKASPVEVMLDPGNYVVDITMSGYAPVSKVVTVDRGGKVVIDENLSSQ